MRHFQTPSGRRWTATLCRVTQCSFGAGSSSICVSGSVLRFRWEGLVDYSRENGADNSEQIQELSEAIVNRAGRTGGTFLHSSRTRPSHLPRERLPAHLTGYGEKVNDVTKDVLKNLEHLGVDVL